MGKSKLCKYWLTYGDWEGSRCLLQFDKPVTEAIANEKSSELKVGQENISGYDSLEEAETAAEKMEENRSKYYGNKEVTKMQKVKASIEEDYGDTVVCCAVCGRIAIGEKGEDFTQTVCTDCGNNEWKVLPFTKGASVRQDPNDGEVAQAGLRKKRVGANINVQASRDKIRKAVFIDGRRDGYGPDQIEGKTMTVGELVGRLQDFDDDSNVFIRNDNGYTYGIVIDDSILGGRYNDDKVILDGDDDNFDENEEN